MEKLRRTQKAFQIFKILTTIGMVFSFLGAAFSILGVILFYTLGDGSIAAIILPHVSSGELNQATAILLSDFVYGLTDGFLFMYAMNYCSTELAEGTPFTHNGAVFTRKLGILTLVVPPVAVIIGGIIHQCFGTDINVDKGNGATFLIGIFLIIFSIIVDYGAELEKR